MTNPLVNGTLANLAARALADTTQADAQLIVLRVLGVTAEWGAMTHVARCHIPRLPGLRQLGHQPDGAAHGPGPGSHPPDHTPAMINPPPTDPHWS